MQGLGISVGLLRRAAAGGVRSALCLLILLGCGARLEAQIDTRELQDKTVSKIEFIGLEGLSDVEVKALMKTKEGRPFRAEDLEDDIRSLAGKVFSTIPSVDVRLDEKKEGVLVLLAGGRNRQVAGIVFYGILEFDRGDLLKAVELQTRRGAFIDDFTLEVDRANIVRHYQSKGFHFAKASILKKRVNRGDLVIFQIVEGPKVHIRDVHFEGAKSFDSGELEDEMPFTEEPGFLGITRKEFVLEEVRRDEKQLTRFYRDQGFLDAKVTLLEWRFTPDNEEVDLYFKIDEGKAFTVRSISFEGMELIGEDVIRPELKTAVGKRYTPGDRILRDLRYIASRYHIRGYINATAVDASTFELDDNVVDVVYKVSEGDLVRVGNIIIKGNLETKDNVIRRDVELYTGEPLNLEKLARARRRIRALQFWDIQPPRFGPGVPAWEVDEEDYVPNGFAVDRGDTSFRDFQIFKDTYVALSETPRENVKDIVVHVREADTGNIRFAAGIGSNAGLIGDITYSKKNFDPFDFPESFADSLDAFTGAGQQLTLSFQPGTQLTRWRAAWGDPRLFDSRYGLSAEVFQTFWLREDWDEDRMGYGVRFGRPFGDDLAIYLRLRDQVVDVNDIDNDAPQLVFDFEGENRLAGLGVEVRYDRREYRITGPTGFFDPLGGYQLSLNYEHAGLWGDIEFDRVRFDGEAYYELFSDERDRPHVLRWTATLGWSSERGDSNDVPVFERFFAGGAGTLRGFAFRGAGPRDRGDPIGGKALWLGGMEYSFPILEDQFRGVTFVDVGSVGLSWDHDSVWDARVSVGFGIRVVIPFLGDRPVAIDLGFPLLKERGDETQLISFSFGSNF